MATKLDEYYGRSIDELPRIVADTERFFAASGLDASLRPVVDLATEELFVNMVSYNTETTREIRIEMTALERGVEVSLTDFDVGRFDPTQLASVDITAPLEQRHSSGLGVFLVFKMTDSVRYEYANRSSRISFQKWVDSTHV